jgi:predicted XRE-type DNA-binding protein
VGASVEAGSGNVFADLDLPNPDLALAKARLVQRIRELISDQELTQTRAAKILGIDQPKVSALLAGRVGGYSLDRLLRFLTALGQEVEISIRPAPSKAVNPSIVVA